MNEYAFEYGFGKSIILRTLLMPIHPCPRNRSKVSGRMDGHRCLELYECIVGKHAKGLGDAMSLELLCGKAYAFRYEVSLEGSHFGPCVMKLQIGGEDIRGGSI